MKNVLIIASDFPPLAKVSVMRTAKFVKYLPSFGWNPFVLTIGRPFLKKGNFNSDFSYEADIPKNVRIYSEDAYWWFIIFKPLIIASQKASKGIAFWKYTGAQYIWQYIFKVIMKIVFPDFEIGWYPFAVRRGHHIIKNYDINMIYSTSPSPVSHLIALKLSKKYCLPWLADFRDPWAYAYFNSLISFVKKFDIILEKRVLERANRCVVALPQIINEFKKVSKYFNPTKCITILNGYDEEDFKDISPHIFKQFTIVYPGRLHRLRRSPRPLFVALHFLFQEYPILKNKIKVIFIGKIIVDTTNHCTFMEELIKEYRLEECVQMLDYIEHKKIVSYMCGADILYLLTEKTMDSEKPFQGKDVIPAKLYEYLRARKPILALISEDCDCAQIIKKSKSGVVVDPQNHQKIKSTILDMYEKYKKGTLQLEPNENLIRQYERKVLTGNLAKVFNDVLLEKNIKNL